MYVVYVYGCMYKGVHVHVYLCICVSMNKRFYVFTHLAVTHVLHACKSVYICLYVDVNIRLENLVGSVH